MRFHADLHVHSKYSRATSRDLDLEHLSYWAARKGVGVVATGDVVHPQWLAEIRQKLVPAEPGLFRLNDDIAEAVARTLPPSCRAPVRFMLSVEISTIYKKHDRTRKIHHLIYAPDFATVDRLAEKLGRIGNIASDGRPILGLDSRDLLEITLESGPGAYLVPAHIWTPWFAALGSQSGFDSIVECYGDLAGHIFAVETGLSSDPAMNFRVSFLDRYRLTSNSDAHSPGRLGREATLFDCDPDYGSIRRALETGEGYVGTVEFFPEEGKYHLDGHRKCEVRLTPRETIEHGGRCPVCGAPVTVGVAHRVEVLADRDEAGVTPPPTAGLAQSLVPLPEVLSEIAGSGPASRTVERIYDRLIAALGPELFILGEAPVEDIARGQSSLLAEAVGRLRAGRVIRDAGYDGAYGVIRLFEDAELKRMTSGELLFETAAIKRKTAQPRAVIEPAPAALPAAPAPRVVAASGEGILSGLDPDQRAAAERTDGPLLIIAGPGSGKTRTLTHRLAHLVVECGVPAAHCLAITFTRRAAAELGERLARLIPADCGEVRVHTFHSLGLAILREHMNLAGLHRGFRVAAETDRAALLAETLGLSMRKAENLLQVISRAKRTRVPTDDDVAQALSTYDRAMSVRNWIDFDDLGGRSVDLLEGEPALVTLYRMSFCHICVDEFQDVDEQQYRLLKLLAHGPATGTPVRRRDIAASEDVHADPKGSGAAPAHHNVCVIGDPDQAIYGFRGADASCFARFAQDFPGAVTIALRRNYRSTGTIAAAASQVIAGSRQDQRSTEVVRGMHERIVVHAAPTEAAEAEFVVQTIERMIGGHSFFSIDCGRATGSEPANLGFADVAVLYRTEAQSAALSAALERSGMPFKTSSHARIGDRPAVQALLRVLDGGATDEPIAAQLCAAASGLPAAGLTAAEIAQAVGWLATLAATCVEDRDRLVAAAALASEQDFFDPRADRVSLMTMHAAKGLEFPVVFVVGLEEGLMPLVFGAPDPTAEEEERRLLYVAMTRARDRLYLTRAAERLWRGKLRRPEPSRFLADIEAELMGYQRVALPQHKPRHLQLELF
jgi:uncharacterized protein (TIGR00375 family)